MMKVEIFFAETIKVDRSEQLEIEQMINFDGTKYRFTSAIMHQGETTHAGHFVALGKIKTISNK
jgi:uncharacterized UBP type Zn finger protein